METKFIEQNIDEIFQSTFLEYAGYNIQRRAIPDARDGLKWGARQLLYSQMLGGFTYDKPFKKAIKSVSQAMGFCYVHGDASAYGTFIRMAKPFSYRYPLQEANGNYGTLINPEDHSASRYVELRGSRLAAQVLVDIKKDTITEWEDTYDLEGQFPKVFPSKGIWLGINGCISIGSGMSCSIPPTNLKEVNDVLIKLLQNPDLPDDECVCMPDFPTGATILNAKEVHESMKCGHGAACKIRASVQWDEQEKCFRVIEMPYSTFTNTICSELANLMENDPNCGVIDFKDYTGSSPDLRIYVNKKTNPDKVLKYLYKNTSLESFFSINMTMLDNGTTPRVFTWKEALQSHIDHEKIVYRRSFEYDLKKICDRIHIIRGLLICCGNIEDVVRTIKNSKSTADASVALQNKFLLDEVQAKAVLDMKLAKLANLEVKKLEDEKTSLENEAARINAILSDETLFNQQLINGWRDVAAKFGDERRTKVMNLSSNENDEPIEIKQVQISFTNKDNIYATESSTLYAQKRGGIGTKMKLLNNEYIKDTIACASTDTLLIFTDIGNYYSCPVSEITFDTRIPIASLVHLPDEEHVSAVVNMNHDNNKKHIIFITKNGIVKKSLVEDYNTKRSAAVRAINLDENDSIVDILFTNDEPIGLLSKNGNFIIINSKDIRPIGRIAHGVHGMKLNDGDYVIKAHLIKPTAKEIVSISRNGYIKRTDIEEFEMQGINTKGSRIQKFVGADVAADFLPMHDLTELTIGACSSYIKVNVNDIPHLSKGTQGVRAIKLDETNYVNCLL